MTANGVSREVDMPTTRRFADNHRHPTQDLYVPVVQRGGYLLV